jgi:transposase-like protein
MGRKSDFDPATFCAVLEPLGGVLNRSNVDEAAAKLGVSVRTTWRWWNQFKNNDLKTADKMDKIDDINRNAAAAIAATYPPRRGGMSAMAAAAAGHGGREVEPR